MKNKNSKIKILSKVGSLLSLSSIVLVPIGIIGAVSDDQILVSNKKAETTDNITTINDDSAALTTNSPVEAVGDTFERSNESGGGTIKYTVLTEDAGSKTGTVSVSSGTAKPTGTLDIPETVTYDDFTYTLTQLSILAFKDCVDITTAIIPDGNIYWFSFVFSGCTNLTSLTIGSGSHGIKSGDFAECTSLNHIDVSGNSNFAMVGGADQYTGCLVQGTTIASDCSNIIITTHEVVLPYTVTSIKAYAFFGCSLTNITISNHVTSIGESAFQNCKSLETINIPTSVTVIETSTFMNCEKLNNVIIPDSVTTIGFSAFQSCAALISVIIPDSVTTIESSAFQSCAALISVIIPDNVTSMNWNVFLGCSSLVSVKIGSGITEISPNTFLNCISLTEIIMPDSVTSIGASAFSNCTSLSAIEIGENIQTIGDQAFKGCTGLISIRIDSTEPPSLGDDVFLNVSSNLRIYVPVNAVDAYKIAPGWSDELYKNRIFADIIITIKGIKNLNTSFGVEHFEQYTITVNTITDTPEVPDVSWQLIGDTSDGKIKINEGGKLTIPADLQTGEYACKIVATSTDGSNIKSAPFPITVTVTDPITPDVITDNSLAIIIGCSVGGVVLLGTAITGTIIGVKKHHKNKK